MVLVLRGPHGSSMLKKVAVGMPHFGRRPRRDARRGWPTRPPLHTGQHTRHELRDSTMSTYSGTRDLVRRGYPRGDAACPTPLGRGSHHDPIVARHARTTAQTLMPTNVTVARPRQADHDITLSGQTVSGQTGPGRPGAACFRLPHSANQSTSTRAAGWD